MSLMGDPYREYELYLEQAECEITQAFENGTFQSHLPQERPKLENKTDSYELDPFLLQFNATIAEDLTEILARYTNGKNEDHYYDNDYERKWKENLTQNENENHNENGTTCSLESLINSLQTSETNPINAATQTSLSLSPTNLTWTSECSSSPCLTSDSDLVDEDSHSTSSITEQFLSPSSTWDRDHGRWQQILSTKSSSAPALKKVGGPIKVNKQARSQSDRHLAEIEADEACKWLRAAGFPQYAQMYEDNQFPIDLSTVAQDHPLLEADLLHSLFRRLQILNSCAHLHQQRINHNHTDDDSEEEYCALSDNWTYQTDIKRWSRNCKASNPNEDDEVFLPNAESQSPKERLRRAGSTKFRRRPEGVVINSDSSGSGSQLLTALSEKLGQFKTSHIYHVSDSECSPKHIQRPRTKSFDTTDTWLHSPQISNHRTAGIWYNALPPQEEPFLEQSVNLGNGGPPISTLSCTQLQVLRKLALLKLTAHMEKYCPSLRSGWTWDLPKFLRKTKNRTYKDKFVFGVPLSLMLQRTGQPLPKNIEEALLWLENNAADQVGLFRKSGVKSRIQTLRNTVENSSEILVYNDQQSYDVADMVKQYFRELPETLFTNKLSEALILIFQYVPTYLRRESVLCALLLMPDEHVQVLQCLIKFLRNVAQHVATNQMNESNLALCFSPSLFHLAQGTIKHNSGAPHPKELAETRAGHDCLLYLLKNSQTLFKVPKEFVNQCKSSEFKETKAVKLEELGRSMGGWREYLNECQQALLKEGKERCRGWSGIPSNNPKIEISYKKVADGHPLRLWKVAAEIEAPPAEVVRRIIRERHIWDPDLISAKIVAQIEQNGEIFQYVRRTIDPLPNEEYCVVRTWRTDLPKDTCLIVETSIEHQDATPIPNTVRGIVLASRYLIEPCGSGRSRLLHLSRIDSMGKTPEWYQKNYGHISAIFISNIVQSFYQVTLGPESKV